MDRRERRARRLERRLEAAQGGVEETEEMGVTQVAEKPGAAEETVYASEKVKTLEERRAARRERALKLAERDVESEKPKHLEAGTLEEALVATAAAPDEVVAAELPGLVDSNPISTILSDGLSDALERALDKLASCGAIRISKVGKAWLIEAVKAAEVVLGQLGSRLDVSEAKVGKTSNKRTPRGYKESDFYTPEYAEFKVRWAKMTLDEKLAEVQTAGVTWHLTDDPLIQNMRMMMALLDYKRIAKWKPGFESDAKRRASVGH